MKKIIIPATFILSIVLCLVITYWNVYRQLSYSKKSTVEVKRKDISLNDVRKILKKEPESNKMYYQKLTIRKTYSLDGLFVTCERDTFSAYYSDVIN